MQVDQKLPTRAKLRGNHFAVEIRSWQAATRQSNARIEATRL
jgi:hypothetical protein